MKLLIVEDDATTADFICKAFKEHGHAIDHAISGQDGLTMATTGAYDVLVLDRMLPELDGLTMVRALRAADVKTPVLMLTSMGGIDDRVEGLEAGGDDYLIKPFAFTELLARVHALARRPPYQAMATALTVADLHLDVIKRVVTRGGRKIDLQQREFQLLEFLMRHAGRVVTRTMLLEAIWNFHFDPKTNIVETHISRLRGKINGAADPELIHTVRGEGYCLRDRR